MRPEKNDIWFPAKRYGWGWGWPMAWQGWVVYLVYTVLLLAGANEYAQTRDPRFFIFFAVISAGLIAICWQKGETPRWRWGRDDD